MIGWDEGEYVGSGLHAVGKKVKFKNLTEKVKERETEGRSLRKFLVTSLFAAFVVEVQSSFQLPIYLGHAILFQQLDKMECCRQMRRVESHVSGEVQEGTRKGTKVQGRRGFRDRRKVHHISSNGARSSLWRGDDQALGCQPCTCRRKVRYMRKLPERAGMWGSHVVVVSGRRRV